MKRLHQKFGFTLIELLVTLAIIGVFCVILTQLICLENHLAEESQAMLCIQNEERYVSEFLFETLYGVENIQVEEEATSLPLSAFNFSYEENQCPILGFKGEKLLRFVQEDSQLQIWEMYRGIPQIKKAIAYHVVDANCKIIPGEYGSDKPVLHITLQFEAGHTQKSYELLFAMRNLS